MHRRKIDENGAPHTLLFVNYILPYGAGTKHNVLFLSTFTVSWHLPVCINRVDLKEALCPNFGFFIWSQINVIWDSLFLLGTSITYIVLFHETARAIHTHRRENVSCQIFFLSYSGLTKDLILSITFIFSSLFFPPYPLSLYLSVALV